MHDRIWRPMRLKKRSVLFHRHLLAQFWVDYRKSSWISFILLYFSAWLVLRSYATFSTNQIQNTNHALITFVLLRPRCFACFHDAPSLSLWAISPPPPPPSSSFDWPPKLWFRFFFRHSIAKVLSDVHICKKWRKGERLHRQPIKLIFKHERWHPRHEKPPFLVHFRP